MLFILSTSLFVVLHTFFGNFWPAAGGGFFLIVGIMIRSFLQKISLRLSFVKIGCVVLTYFLTVASVSFFIYSYQKKGGEFGSTYTGSGEIIENQGSGRYVFRDKEGRDFLYYSDTDYLLGSTISTVSQLKAASLEVDWWSSPSWADLYEKAALVAGVEREFDMDRRMVMKGRSGVLYEKQGIVLHSHTSSRLLRRHQNIVSVFQGLYRGRGLGLSLGMFMGDRSHLSKEEYSSFVESGLVHIIAVSGGNIVLLVAFLSVLLFFLPYYLRSILIALSIVMYASLCGWDSSVVRASIMALLSIGAIFFGRALQVWRSMAYVYVGMLLRNPYYLLYDLGFIFSFAALAGLAFFSQRRNLTTKKKISFRFHGELCKDLIKRFRNLYLLPSIAAAVGIFTPLLFFTSRVNLVSIVSNVLIVPLVPLVMIYGFFSALLYSVTARHRLAYPQIWSIDWIYAVNQRSNDHSVVIYAQAGWARIIILILTFGLITTIVMLSHRSR